MSTGLGLRLDRPIVFRLDLPVLSTGLNLEPQSPLEYSSNDSIRIFTGWVIARQRDLARSSEPAVKPGSR